MSETTTTVTLIQLAQRDNDSLGEFTTGIAVPGFWYLPGAESGEANAAAEKALGQAGFKWTSNSLEVLRARKRYEGDQSP